MSNLMRPLSLVPMVFGDFEKEFNRIMNNQELSIQSASDWQPKIDILNEANQFVVKVDIPGVDPKDIDIAVNRNSLTIKGERETEREEKKENFVCYERSKGSFYRYITLPETADAEKIIAESKNGVLKITVPKSSKEIARKIEVKS